MILALGARGPGFKSRTSPELCFHIFLHTFNTKKRYNCFRLIRNKNLLFERNVDNWFYLCLAVNVNGYGALMTDTQLTLTYIMPHYVCQYDFSKCWCCIVSPSCSCDVGRLRLPFSLSLMRDASYTGDSRSELRRLKSYFCQEDYFWLEQQLSFALLFPSCVYLLLVNTCYT